MKILACSYMCDPGAGSESALGWGRVSSISRDHEVWVLTKDDPDKRRRIEESLAEHPNRNLHIEYVAAPKRMWRPPEPNPLMYFLSSYTTTRQYNQWGRRASERGRQLADQIGFDLMHHISFAGLYHGSCLASVPGSPLVIGPVGSGVSANPIFRRYFGRQWLGEYIRTLGVKASLTLPVSNHRARAAAQRAAVVICSNPETKRLAERLGAKVIRERWDASLDDTYAPSIRPTKPGDILRLIWVGSLYPIKCIQLALDILAAVPRDVPFRMDIFGDGPEKLHLEAWIRERQLQERVVYRGKVGYEELKRHYAESHALLFTSVRDNAGNQLLEAMSHGTIPMALQQGGTPYLVTDGRDGYVFPITAVPRIVQDWSSALVDLWKCDGKREDLANRAFDRAKEFRTEPTARYLESVYSSVVATGSRQ